MPAQVVLATRTLATGELGSNPIESSRFYGVPDHIRGGEDHKQPRHLADHDGGRDEDAGNPVSHATRCLALLMCVQAIKPVDPATLGLVARGVVGGTTRERRLERLQIEPTDVGGLLRRCSGHVNGTVYRNDY